MARSTFITSNIHFDRLYKSLTADEKKLYVDLLTHPNGNKAGFFQIDINIQQIIRKAGADMPSEDECRAELERETGLWFYERKTDLVLIPTYLKYNKIGSAKTFQSMKYELEQLPPSRLCLEFIYRLNEYTEGKGVDYLPTKMIECAKAYIKQGKRLNIHEALIEKIIC